MTNEQIVWNWLDDVQHQICYELKELKETHLNLTIEECNLRCQKIRECLGERFAYQRMLVKIFLVDNDEIRSCLNRIALKFS